MYHMYTLHDILMLLIFSSDRKCFGATRVFGSKQLPFGNSTEQ